MLRSLITLLPVVLFHLSDPCSAASPLPAAIQDLAVLSPTQHIYVNGSGVPTILTALQPGIPVSFAGMVDTTPKTGEKRPWPMVVDARTASYYGVAALGDGETVFLADTRYHVVQAANLKTGTRRLLYDPALLEVFAGNTSGTTGSGETLNFKNNNNGDSYTNNNSNGESLASTINDATSLNGIIRTSREGRGDVLVVGLNNQIWRVPANRPGVANLGDSVEMLAAGYGRWYVRDVAQYDNRVVVSLLRFVQRSGNNNNATNPVNGGLAGTGGKGRRTNIRGRAAATPSALPGSNIPIPPDPTNPKNSGSRISNTTATIASHAIVIRYNVMPNEAAPLTNPRIVRRVRTKEDVLGSSQGMKIDVDQNFVYVADKNFLAVHNLGNGREARPAIRTNIDTPTAVVVRNGVGVLVTGTCEGSWCSQEVAWADVQPVPVVSNPTTSAGAEPTDAIPAATDAESAPPPPAQTDRASPAQPPAVTKVVEPRQQRTRTVVVTMTTDEPAEPTQTCVFGAKAP
ncbi:hypothetical protein DFJ77DRAFT_460012 [Powellomyces hirtus]|nr:hypothetical protein DFJ77DRAFT_460012 [Powellomyces hirtus]